MTRQEAFDEINNTQDIYINELIGLIRNPDYEHMRAINFSSATGTGKTKMMSKLINKFPDCYFIITTLSKGQLHIQVRDNLMKDCTYQNFHVYGNADYKINSRLQAEDILNDIPSDSKCIWLRDEGHIRTNKFEELLIDRCYKVINFSATNMHSDIQCNFMHTMMLRTVNQTTGTPDDAIHKLLNVKAAHKNVTNYNPCAIFRCVSGDTKIYDRVVDLCDKYHLKYIDITATEFDMSELCKDDNEYDVIINKFKIVEGIDIRRAHVLYMDNQPSNNATTIQIIGRCRRNALLYRDDIDILAPENENLLKQTRNCYVYYNIQSMKVDTDKNGELQYAFCNHISCEALRPGSTIEVINGQLKNGLYVIELEGMTGIFDIVKDKNTGFNIVSPISPFYNEEIVSQNEYIYFEMHGRIPYGNHIRYKKIKTQCIPLFPLKDYEIKYSWATGEDINIPCEPYYDVLRLDKYTKKSPVDELSVHIEDVTDTEIQLLSKGLIKCYYINRHHLFTQKEYDVICENNGYKKIYNDRESAIIGVDLMRQIKTDIDVIWSESKSISSKIGNYNKFNAFISNRYKHELEYGKSQCFNGKTEFGLNKRCNSMIGYCVEYYSKWFLYGDSYLEPFIEQAKKESHAYKINDPIIIRACMLKYKAMMIQSFGSSIAKVIPNTSVQVLVQQQYKNFVILIIWLGIKTASYVKSKLYPNIPPTNDVDPNLSIKHIAGLADYITKDTILDVKVRNNIDEKCVRQVLAYHYLSTKRSDLDIKQVIVYDAVSGRSVIVHIGNCSDNSCEQLQINNIESEKSMINSPRQMKCGMSAVISGFNFNDTLWCLFDDTITIRFENGVIAKSSVYDFRNGNSIYDFLKQ